MDFFGPRNPFSGDPSAAAAAANAKRKADSVELDIAVLERRVDRLALVCEALWELLSEKTGATPQEVMDRVLQIDLRDGTQDGKITPKIVPCKGCGRKVNNIRDVCMYCGAPIPHETLVM